MQLLDRIDEARERWDVLRHPFYVRWERGELKRDELAFYAGEYRHAVVALADAAAASGDADHAREEREHVTLWDDFVAGPLVARGLVYDTSPTDGNDLWRLLYRPNASATEDDRHVVREWARRRGEIADYDIGPLTSVTRDA